MEETISTIIGVLAVVALIMSIGAVTYAYNNQPEEVDLSGVSLAISANTNNIAEVLSMVDDMDEDVSDLIYKLRLVDKRDFERLEEYSSDFKDIDDMEDGEDGDDGTNGKDWSDMNLNEYNCMVTTFPSFSAFQSCLST